MRPPAADRIERDKAARQRYRNNLLICGVIVLLPLGVALGMLLRVML